MKYWDYELNDIKPEDLTLFSHLEAHWICLDGHRWKAVISNFVKGSRCPYCSGRLPIRGVSDLETLNPELAKEWHPTKNGDTTPSDVMPGSHRKAWWIGKCGHEWDAPIYSRVAGNGCPYCRGLKVLSGFNDLATTDRDIALMWHPTKNGDLKPTDITAGSSRIVWWRDHLGHEWQAPPKALKRGRYCPICAGRKVLVGFNDLNSEFPEVASEWNYERNNGKEPTDYTSYSNMPVWWKCSNCGHEWEAIISDRTRGRTGCPKCDSDYKTSFGEKALCFYLSQMTDVEENYRAPFLGKMELDIYIPSIRVAVEYDGRQWHKSEERDIRKNGLCKENGIEVIRMREDDREIEGSTNIHVDYWNYGSMTRGIESVCRIIADRLGSENVPEIDVESDAQEILGKKYRTRKTNSLAAKNPELIEEWDYEKNGSLKPDSIPFKSNKKVWWKGKCGHSWQSAVFSKVSGNGCPICDNKVVLAGFNDLESKYPNLAKEWNYEKNGGLKPSEVTSKSSKLVWWKCSVCGYEWEKSVGQMVRRKTFCVACGRKKPNNEDLH